MPDPRTRRLLPVDDRLPNPQQDRQPIRRHLYERIKDGPITASEAARVSDLSLVDARDELRIMENWLLVDHVVDDLGVVRWQWKPDNYWEADPVPF